MKPDLQKSGQWTEDKFTPYPEFATHRTEAFAETPPIPIDAPILGLQWQDRIQWDFNLGGFEDTGRSYFVEILDPGTNAVLTSVTKLTAPQSKRPSLTRGCVGLR